eukprot:3107771-Rhodomonas_salina.1
MPVIIGSCYARHLSVLFRDFSSFVAALRSSILSPDPIDPKAGMLSSYSPHLRPLIFNCYVKASTDTGRLS